LQACPNATVLAHPRAAPHLIDPSHLIASAKKVYGEPVFNDLYGELTPINSSRIRIMQDQETLHFGSRELTFIHTRGHANHHFCILDSGSNGIFTGDAFGLAYPSLQRNGLFIFPSTSPTDFNPTEARLSIQKILATGAQRAFLTHFGMVSDLEQAAAQLHQHLDFSEEVLEAAVQYRADNKADNSTSSDPDAGLDEFCRSKLEPYFRNLMTQQGLEFAWEFVKMDLDLNSAGIAHAARKQRKKTQPHN
jgi:glyoxylase-like metal-dependent hydrolase (beta-lactamase superfamily II)